ncbi:MAG: ferredoxin [Acidimicrobiales bacterium]|nr:ferredoxin [Acidimicrobiales bacterium]
MTVDRHLELDPVACDGFGHCAELLPELISLDEWGYPVVERRPIPAPLLEHVDRAVRACPRDALRVRRERRA